MKPIQVMFDEQLLRRLDETEETRRLGRSAVLRRAATEYLRRRRGREIADAYRRGYGSDSGLGNEWSGWESEGVWPGK